MDKKYLFGWNNIKWGIIEIVKTFSNKPSFFARKRIESFILFANAIILLDAWYIKAFDKVDYMEALAVFGAQMLYAGYQVSQIRKDIQLEKNLEKKEEPQG